jgi:hypothetical protein
LLDTNCQLLFIGCHGSLECGLMGIDKMNLRPKWRFAIVLADIFCAYAQRQVKFLSRFLPIETIFGINPNEISIKPKNIPIFVNYFTYFMCNNGFRLTFAGFCKYNAWSENSGINLKYFYALWTTRWRLFQPCQIPVQNSDAYIREIV